MDLICNAAAKRSRSLLYHVGQPSLLAHVYFSLHDSFKGLYVEDGHLSDAAKRAAASCATVIAVAPLHENPNNPPVDPNTRPDLYYPNAFLAARCACAYMPHPFEKKTWDARRKDYIGYTGLSFPSVEEIILEWESHAGRVVSTFDAANLSTQEIASLSLLATSFQTASHFQIPEQLNR
jgi:hypothetical protein